MFCACLWPSQQKISLLARLSAGRCWTPESNELSEDSHLGREMLAIRWASFISSDRIGSDRIASHLISFRLADRAQVDSASNKSANNNKGAIHAAELGRLTPRQADQWHWWLANGRRARSGNNWPDMNWPKEMNATQPIGGNGIWKRSIWGAHCRQ